MVRGWEVLRGLCQFGCGSAYLLDVRKNSNALPGFGPMEKILNGFPQLHTLGTEWRPTPASRRDDTRPTPTSLTHSRMTRYILVHFVSFTIHLLRDIICKFWFVIRVVG